MAQNKLVAIEICLAEGKPEARGQTPAGLRQERTIWTAWQAPGRHQGGRKGLVRQPARHQGGTREAGKDQLDSLEAQGGTRTNCEAPGRHQGLLKAILCYERTHGLGFKGLRFRV